MGDKERATYLKVVGKTFAIIETMAQTKTTIRLTDLSQRLKQPKATVFRILYTLRQLGYVRQDPRTETYQLTGRITYNIRDNGREALKAVAHPYMEKLLGRFEQTVCLGVLEHGQVFYVEILEGIRAIRMAALPNTYAPIHATALGKSILAFLEPQQARQILNERPLRKFTERTITSPSLLLRSLSRIRDQGFAVDNEETERGARCVAAPICNSQGKAFAAISVSGPVSHIRRNSFGEIALVLKEVTQEISARLGGENRMGDHANPPRV